jgi:hypothetical protein
VCETPAEVLALNDPSPLYCAVKVLVPPPLKTRLQLVVGRVATQFTAPSVTVTTPVGVPIPGTFTVTVTVIVTA